MHVTVIYCPFVDRQIAENLMYQMRNQRVTLRLGENVEGIEKINTDEIHVKLESQKILPLLYSSGGSRASDLLIPVV